jgi:hypothetical protein
MHEDLEAVHRRAADVTRIIHDAHVQDESNNRIRRVRWERRAMWDEIERLESEILGIDDSYDDPEGEKEVVTKEEYAAGVKGTGDTDAPLDIFEEQFVEGKREEPPQAEASAAVVHQVPKGRVAGANECFLPSGEMIYLKMGDMKCRFSTKDWRRRPAHYSNCDMFALS